MFCDFKQYLLGNFGFKYWDTNIRQRWQYLPAVLDANSDLQCTVTFDNLRPLELVLY